MRVGMGGFAWALVGLSLIFGCRVGGASTSAPAATASPAEERHWYGVYLAGRKVGHAEMRVTSTSAGVVAQDRIVMEVIGGGHGVTLTIEQTRRYAPDPPHRLLEAVSDERSPQMHDRRVAIRHGDVMRITRVIDGVEQSPREVAASAETLTDFELMAPQDPSALRVGEVAKASVFDWQVEKDDTVEVRLLRVASVPHAGVDVMVAELELRYVRSGVTARSHVAAGGLGLKMTMGMGLELRLEEQAVAASGVAGLDVLSAGLEVSSPLGNPGQVKTMTATLGTAPGATIPSSGRQRVERLGEHGYRVVVDPRATDPLAVNDRKAWLGPDTIVDSEHGTIVAKARALTRGMTRDDEKVMRLVNFVDGHVKDALATHLPSASQVLARAVGDCTEHAWLFTALARAAGLPARPAYGIAYVGDSSQKFGYHAWVEVVVDGHWRAVDPMWGQARADGTHLLLAYEPLAIAPMMGGLTIRVDDVRIDAGDKRP